MATKTQKKYKLLKNDTKTSWNGKTLFRIKALKDFSIFHKGEKGGYIENEANLSHDDKSWVFGNAQVFGDGSGIRRCRYSATLGYPATLGYSANLGMRQHSGIRRC